jgi:short-subunit dehydrogenase
MTVKMINRGTALITGASTGIGLEFAKRFAKDGYHLVLVARNRERLEEVATSIPSHQPVSVHVIDLDLSDIDAPQRLYDLVRGMDIHIDVLVNNAGIGIFGEFAQTDRVTELKMIDLNVRGLTDLTKLFLPQMIEKGSGSILNVASTAAFQPGPLMAVYYATKAYVLSFSEALANELKGTGVTISAFCPGPTATEFQERANMNASRLQLLRMDVNEAVNIGYQGFKQRRTIIIPGFRNRFLVTLVRFLPRIVVTAIVRAVSGGK